ncbi:MAG: RlpA-like protein [Alphaproteobacteria bacterium MarineAlpha3_Bin5]|nr:MAG: RlpA-like protein [Alphaproteobacteria bacterium MarineAlpha3_Bin5]
MSLKFPKFNKIWIIIFSIMLTSCAETEFVASTAKRISRAVSPEPEKPKGIYKIGKPYKIQGVWYYPEENYEFDETGIASWYGKDFHGRKTANGEIYDMNDLTVAHRTLPMPSFVRVTNLENGRSLVLRVNDRGPFARGRILDASRRSAELLGFREKGTARVRVQIAADRSRAVAIKMKSDTTIAALGSPIIVNSVPKAAVNVEVLQEANEAETSKNAIQVVKDSNKSSQRASVSSDSNELNKPLSEKIEYGEPLPTNIFIQAGAFGVFANANRVKAKLSPLGSVSIGQALVRGKDLYRVRLGPIATVLEADSVLDSVVKIGYPEARIILD